MVTVAKCNFCAFLLTENGSTVVHVVPVRVQTIGVLEWLTGTTSHSGLSGLVKRTLTLLGRFQTHRVYV